MSCFAISSFDLSSPAEAGAPPAAEDPASAFGASTLIAQSALTDAEIVVISFATSF